MEIKPFFSVCIPTYNYGDLLPEAIESVLNQSFQNFELLIQDDCSTDNTNLIIEKYPDPRIKFERNSKNLGIFGNLNNVCARASGQYIKILCADDVLSVWCLETIYNLLQDRNFECNLISVKETPDRKLISEQRTSQKVEYFSIDRNNIFTFLTEPDNWGGGLAELCVNRDFFEKGGYFGAYDRDKDFSRDIIVWLDMVLITGALLITQPLVYQRPHAGQARYSLARLPQLKEIFEFFHINHATCAAHKDFENARKIYLGRYVVSHYWMGIKSLVRGNGFNYILQLHAVLEKYDYDGFPWKIAFEKVVQRINGFTSKTI